MPRASMLSDIAQDVHVSLRGLLRAPLLTLTIVATVGLGIGATTAIFSAVDAALLRPLPYPASERLVWIYTDAPPFQFRFSVADYLALERQATAFEAVAAFTGRTMTFSGGGTADVVQGRAVSWTYFRTLGIVPALGRDFAERDGTPGSPPAVIVSHGFWQRRLGGREDAVGKVVRLDGAAHTVAGVLPARVGPLEARQEYFVAAQFGTPPRRGPFPYWVIGRLRPGGDRGAAASELHAINRRIFPIWKSSYQDEKATWSLMDLQSRLVGDAGTTAGLALAAVALVWLIACVNASNLLIARVTSRGRELAVRAALGASRGRVVRFLLVESALLAAGAAAVGIAIAWAGIALVRGMGAGYFPRTQEVVFDGETWTVLAAAMLFSLVIFGGLPSLHATAGPVDEPLRSAGRAFTGGRAARRLRHALVAAQVAVSTPLLVAAALLLVSLNGLHRVDLGFDGRNLVTGSLRLPASLYRGPEQVEAFWDELARRFASLSGVAGVAFADSLPPDGASNINNFDLEAFPTPAGQSQPSTPWVAVTPEYFGVLGLARVEGRLLDRRDVERESLEAVVVDRAWANRFFPGGSAVGKRFKEGGCTACPWTTVVGVVSDVRYSGLDGPTQGTVYWPLTGGPSRFVVLRTHADPRAVAPLVRQAVHGLDPDVPLTSVATVDDLVGQSLERPESLSLLVASFALVALVLSAVGIYGVMAFYVQQHGRDIGIRLALGGRGQDVVRLVVGQGMRVVLAGVAAGLLIAYASTRLLATLLFGVAPADPPTFLAVSLFLVAVALLACLLPALRAVRVQPAVVLRTE